MYFGISNAIMHIIHTQKAQFFKNRNLFLVSGGFRKSDEVKRHIVPPGVTLVTSLRGGHFLKQMY